MKEASTYQVSREYSSQYGLEELMRRIIRCHLVDDSHVERADVQFPEYKADDYGVQITG